mgnify:CR=1 FL=1
MTGLRYSWVLGQRRLLTGLAANESLLTGAAVRRQLLERRQDGTGRARAVVAHTDSWSHLTENRAAVERAFRAAGLHDRLQSG